MIKDGLVSGQEAAQYLLEAGWRPGRSSDLFIRVHLNTIKSTKVDTATLLKFGIALTKNSEKQSRHFSIHYSPQSLALPSQRHRDEKFDTALTGLSVGCTTR